MGKEESLRLEPWEKGQDGFPTRVKAKASRIPLVARSPTMLRLLRRSKGSQREISVWATMKQSTVLGATRQRHRRLSLPFNNCHSRELAVWVVREQKEAHRTLVCRKSTLSWHGAIGNQL
jgi:hypothetical protein